MPKKATKLNYKYIVEPFLYYKGDRHKWSQDLVFHATIGDCPKKKLYKMRSALVKDVAKLFAKYGIDTEAFNCQNDYI